MQKKLTRSHNSQLKVLDSLRVIIVEKTLLTIICPPPLAVFTLTYACFLPCFSLRSYHPFTHLPHLAALLLAIIPHPGPLLSFATPFSRPIIFSLSPNTLAPTTGTLVASLSRGFSITPRGSRSAATLSTGPVQLRAPSSEQR